MSTSNAAAESDPCARGAGGFGSGARTIVPLIRLIRDVRVILDPDLALLYGVETRALVQAVKRTAERFPEDFLFQLTPAEAAALRSQIVISKTGRGGRRCPPMPSPNTAR